jgi:hypothetical protein
VAALWAYYHLVKQHYGFMVLYKKKMAISRVSITFSIAGCCCLRSIIRSYELIARDPEGDGACAGVAAWRRQWFFETAARGDDTFLRCLGLGAGARGAREMRAGRARKRRPWK